jgi:hypothetical protein
MTYDTSNQLKPFSTEVARKRVPHMGFKIFERSDSESEQKDQKAN